MASPLPNTSAPALRKNHANSARVPDGAIAARSGGSTTATARGARQPPRHTVTTSPERSTTETTSAWAMTVAAALATNNVHNRKSSVSVRRARPTALRAISAMAAGPIP